MSLGVYVLTAVVGALILVVGGCVWRRRLQPAPRGGLDPRIPTLPCASESEGNLPDVKAAGSMHEFMRRFHAQYGPVFAFRWGTTACVSCADSATLSGSARLFDKARLRAVSLCACLHRFVCVCLWACVPAVVRRRLPCVRGCLNYCCLSAVA